MNFKKHLTENLFAWNVENDSDIVKSSNLKANGREGGT